MTFLKTLSTRTAALAMAFATVASMAGATSPLAPPVANPSFEAGHIQTLTVTSTRGATSMTQSFAPGLFGAETVRVCVVNYGNRDRAFTHAVRGINPLVARANGGQSCANFSSSARVAFGMMDGGEPAQANRAMVMSLSAFQGGMVTFHWY